MVSGDDDLRSNERISKDQRILDVYGQKAIKSIKANIRGRESDANLLRRHFDSQSVLMHATGYIY